MRETQSGQHLAAPAELASTVIRRFDLVRDIEWVYQLWNRSFGPKWALEQSVLGNRIGAATMVHVAETHGMPVAISVVGYRETQTAGLLLIMVEPGSRGQGIGKKLLTYVERALATVGVRQLTLGFGSAGGYFWPGVPVDQLSAWPFFRRNGWQERERSFDLVHRFQPHVTPSWVHEQLARTGTMLRLANAEDAQALTKFEEANFPIWAPFFRTTFQEEGYRNILLAQDIGGAIVGTLLLQTDGPVLWSRALGVRFGSLSVLGVAPEQQGRGTGIALAATAMEIIKQRGGSGCYIQWTGLVDWYGKLGTEIWSEYRMSSKGLSQSNTLSGTPGEEVCVEVTACQV